VFDADEYRDRAAASWEAAAPGWGEQADALQRAARPVSEWMVDAIDPQPGQTLVELAAGAGETGFLAVERAQPGGRLLCTDGSPEMLAVAKARAEARGIADLVQFRPMPAEWLDLSAATVDAILCRWGYMLLADPETALREARRVLRPDGHLALAAWSARGRNPWSTVFTEVLLDQGLVEPADPALPGMFSFAEDGLIDELLGAAGFQDIVVEALPFTYELESADAWWHYLSSISPQLRTLLPDLAPRSRDALREGIDAAYAPYTAADGSLSLPAETWVAAALA
jgi:ubiquinone/menaquinone biosynthesis C-methylase UbiE